MTMRKSEVISSITGIKIIVSFEIYRYFNQTISLITYTKIKVSNSREYISTTRNG